MLFAGQQSAFPKLLFIENHMKIERLIKEGLTLGGSDKADIEGMATGDQPQARGHVMRSSAEPSTEDEDEGYYFGKEDRRTSVIQELKRQGSVFHEDSDIEGDTGVGEGESALAS